MDTPARTARIRAPANSRLEFSVKKSKALPHRNRGKSARHRAKLKSKHQRVRLRKSSGQRKTYR
jgi:hypothetical protein